MKQLTDGEKKGTLWTVRTPPERYTAEKRFKVEGDWGEKTWFNQDAAECVFRKMKNSGSSTGDTFKLTSQSEVIIDKKWQFQVDFRFQIMTSQGGHRA